MKQRPIKSYLYDFINSKYINNSKATNFKQWYLQKIKDKKSFDEIKNFTDTDFFDEIIDFFNDEWKKILQDKLWDDKLKNLIRDFEIKINDNFIFRYYQYLSILYTYFVFVIIQDEEKQEVFLNDFKHYLKSYDIDLDVKSFDLKRLNFWMATWSWKTFLMYFILELYLDVFWENVDNIFLVVPAGLRRQHIQELWKIYNREFKTTQEWKETTYNSSILWINIVLTSTTWLDNIIKNREINLEIWKHIFIYDEGHKWAWSDWNTEKNKENIIKNKNNFIFDYSATFQEVIKWEIEKESNKKNKNTNFKINTLNTYFLTSVYNYNLTFFQNDGYGKKINYHFWDLSEKEEQEKEKQKSITKENLKKALNSFSLQLEEFAKNKDNQEIKFYKPLFLWVSNEIWSWKSWEEEKNNIIDVINSLISLYNEENLKNIFWEKKEKISFEIWKEEILINLGDKKGLIYTWSDWIKKVANDLLKNKDEINISQNHNDDIFENLDNKEDVVFLFWSKKFIEWWDSKRPSSIFLLKWAKTSTVQAVQLLGRWLRLSWYNTDWFRHLSNDKEYNELEKLYIFGQDTQALTDFLQNANDNTIKIVKYYKTKAKQWLNKLKLPYLKSIETEKQKFIKISLDKNNIIDWKIEINNQKIWFNKEYIKVSKKIEDWDITRNNNLSNNDKINIPYIILKPYIENIVNDLNISDNNKAVFDIKESFFTKLLSEIIFKENTWMNRWEQKKFILSIIKNILNTIYHKIHKENNFEIDYIEENDEDISFDYNITIKTDWNDDNEFFWLKLKEDKKFENIIELKDDNLSDWFEMEDDKNIEIYKKIFDEVKNLENKRKQNKEILNKLDNLIEKKQIWENEADDISDINSLKNKIQNLENQQNNELKIIFENHFEKDWKQEHLYKRLFHFYNKDKSWNESDFEWFTVFKDIEKLKKDDIEISPSSILQLNNYETKIINEIIKKMKEKEQYKEVHLFRNPPSWNKYFVYKNKDWWISKFYPDFIFWFKNKNWKYDILYIDPKWNDEDKEAKTNCLKELNKNFWNEDFKNIDLWNNKILWFWKLNENYENLNNFEWIELNENINSISWIIVST